MTVADFPQIIKDNAVPKSFTLENLEQTIAQIEALNLAQLGQGSLEIRWREKNETIEKAIIEYIISSIAEFYPLTDFTALTSLTRWVKLEFDRDNNPRLAEESLTKPADADKQREDKLNIRWVQLPLLATFGYFDERNTEPVVNLGGINSPRKGRYINIKANFPSRIREAGFNKYCNAVSIFHSCIAKLYSQPARFPIVNQLLVKHHRQYGGHSNFLNLEKRAVVMWIPSFEHLWIDEVIIPRPGDPALFLKLGDHYFLVDLWEISEEDPLKHIVKEFSA